MFSEALAASRELLQPGSAVLLDVEAEADGETVKARVQRITSLDAAAEARHSGIKIYLEGTSTLDSIAEQVGDRGGQGELRLSASLLDDAGREVEFVLPQGIDATPKQRTLSWLRAWPRSAPSDRLNRGRNPCQEGVASL